MSGHQDSCLPISGSGFREKLAGHAGFAEVELSDHRLRMVLRKEAIVGERFLNLACIE